MTLKSVPPTGQAPLIPSPRAAALALYTRRDALWLLAVVLLVVLGFALLVPAFATQVSLVAMLADGSVTAIAALGLLVVVLTGGIDLSVGAVAGLAPILGGFAIGHIGGAGLLGLALGTGAAIGLVSGLLVVIGRLPAFAVTLAMEALLHGAAGLLAATPGRIGGFVRLLPGPDRMVLGVPASLAAMAIIAAMVATFLHAFRGGRILIALGSDREAARAAGLDVRSFGILPYVASGVLATLAGLLSVAAIPSTLAVTEVGGTLTLDALAAVVIGGASLRGGRGSVAGTLLGVALVVMVRRGLGLAGLASAWQGGAVALLILVGLLADSIARRRRDG